MGIGDRVKFNYTLGCEIIGVVDGLYEVMFDFDKTFIRTLNKKWLTEEKPIKRVYSEIDPYGEEDWEE